MRSRQYNQLEAENESLTRSRPAVRGISTFDLHRRLVSPSASLTTSNTTPLEDTPSEKPSGRQSAEETRETSNMAEPRHYRRNMPLPNTPDAPPLFVGPNVTEFLERYQDVAEDCGLSKEEMVKRLPKYCEYTVTRPYVESMKEWEDKDWEALCKAMRKEYEEEDHAQGLRTVAYLRTQFRDKK